MTERFCRWFHKYRLVLLAAWTIHAFVIHYYLIGFLSWDGLAYRLPPVVELMQHGELGYHKFNQWAFSGFLPFAELIHIPFLLVFGLTGLLIGYPLLVFPLCVIAIYKLVRQLTGSEHAGNFGALGYAAVPMVNQQPFTGYIDFIVSAVIAYFVYALLRLRESPRPYHAAIRLAAATVLFTMTRTTGLYIGIMLGGLLGLALFVRRDGFRVRLVDKRVLAIAIAAFVVGSIPAAAIQVSKYLEHGSPIHPYQLNFLGMKLGTGMPMKNLFFYAGLPDDTWYHFGRASIGGWLWPISGPIAFFDSRNMGGGFVLPIALLLVPVFVRSATRFEKWLCVACLLVSFFARDFWLPRYAYTIIVVLAIVIGRALLELARGGRAGRAAFWLAIGALALHGARPELDLYLIGRGSIGPRVNVANSGAFLGGGDSMAPYPDRHAKFVIVEHNWNGFLLPIYGRRLTNEILFTVPKDQLGERCAGLWPIVQRDPTVLFIDDLHFTADCDRDCVIQVPGWCRAYLMFPRTRPIAPGRWISAGHPGRYYLRGGWSFPEDWGTWSIEPVARMEIPIANPGADVVLDLRWHAARPGTTARVQIGDASREIAFGDSLADREDSFVIARASSPIVVWITASELAPSPDGRKLGVGLSAFRVRAP